MTQLPWEYCLVINTHEKEVLDTSILTEELVESCYPFDVEEDDPGVIKLTYSDDDLCDEITEVIIPQGVIDIDQDTFNQWQCQSLQCFHPRQRDIYRI